MEKIEKILEDTEGKILKAEKNSNEILMQILVESCEDARKNSKRLFIICLILIIALFSGLIGQSFYYGEKIERQQILFSEKLEKQQTEFMKFLSESDIASYTQDSAGLNSIGVRSSFGDLINNGAKGKGDTP